MLFLLSCDAQSESRCCPGTQAHAAKADSEAIWLAAFKLEFENKEPHRARVLLQKARDSQVQTQRVWMKSAIVERELVRTQPVPLFVWAYLACLWWNVLLILCFLHGKAEMPSCCQSSAQLQLMRCVLRSAWVECGCLQHAGQHRGGAAAAGGGAAALPGLRQALADAGAAGGAARSVSCRADSLPKWLEAVHTQVRGSLVGRLWR